MGHEQASRRRYLATVAGVAVAGLSGCGGGSSTPTEEDEPDEEDTPTPEAGTKTPAATPTATPTGGSTPTAEGTPEPTATAPETASPTPTATPTPSTADWAAWPTFLYNDQNWGHHPDATGPHDDVSAVWERDLQESQINGTAALVDGTLYVGDGRSSGSRGNFYALDPITGETQWSKQFEGPIRSGPAIGGGYIYIGGGGTMTAFRPNGNEAWSYTSRSDETFTSPTIGDGNIYFGADSGYLYKFDDSSNFKQWDPRLFGEVTTAPIFHDGTVYVSSLDSTVSAWSGNANQDWSVDMGSGVNGLSMRDGRLFAAMEGNAVAQLSASGSEIWRVRTGGAVASTPAVTEDMVYVGTRSNTIQARSRSDGIEQWRFSGASNEFAAPPVVADGTVYAGSRDGYVYALDAETGEEEWSFDTGNDVVDNAPVVAGGMVFIGSQSGTFYAIGNP